MSTWSNNSLLTWYTLLIVNRVERIRIFFMWTIESVCDDFLDCVDGRLIFFPEDLKSRSIAEKILVPTLRFMFNQQNKTSPNSLHPIG